MADQEPLSSVQSFCRRLLVNRFVDEQQPRRQPVVVLLGPAGSGKTESLRAISRDCGYGVVHAHFDFATATGRTEPVTTVEVLTVLARGLARKWTNRRSVRFTRFALGLVAVQAKLNRTDRNRARDDLRAAIRDWSDIPRGRQGADAVEKLLDVAVAINIPHELVVRVLRLVLPGLIKIVVRKRLRGAALHWHTNIPQAQGASPLDALIELHDLARTDPDTATAWLTQAFLADVRDSHPRMAKTEPGAPCSCDEQRRHYHNWVLLLDNLDHPGGAGFVADLSNVRQHHADQHRQDHDALLVVASSGRWNADWEAEWRAPWRAAPIERDGLATVPRCALATYQDWADPNIGRVPPVYYPVLLEPLDPRETARILSIPTTDPRCELARRASGGLPMAVHTLRPLLSGGKPAPGSRNLLGPSTVRSNAAGDRLREADPWHDRLVKLRLHKHFSDIDIGDFVSAAPFATAPWLVPDDAPSLITEPQVGQILTELRFALWVTAPSRGGATPNYAELHPWVAQTLVSALAARPRSLGQYDYPTQFGKLLADQSHDSEPDEDDLVRTAYCLLALGRISDVAEFFTTRFDRGPHQEWIDRLRLVARAPGDQPHDRSSAVLFDELVNSDVKHHPERSDVRNIVIRLVAGLWLAKSPFTMTDPEQWGAIADEYRLLPVKSHRPDVAALNTAAVNAAKGLL